MQVNLSGVFYVGHAPRGWGGAMCQTQAGGREGQVFQETIEERWLAFWESVCQPDR
jgi:hypothetical protein